MKQMQSPKEGCKIFVSPRTANSLKSCWTINSPSKSNSISGTQIGMMINAIIQQVKTRTPFCTKNQTLLHQKFLASNNQSKKILLQQVEATYSKKIADINEKKKICIGQHNRRLKTLKKLKVYFTYLNHPYLEYDKFSYSILK